MKKRINDIILISVFSLLVAFFGFSIFFGLSENTSEWDNRELEPLPRPTAISLSDGSFLSSLSSFYSDRFPLRKELISLKAYCELILGKGENKNTVVGKDGYLFEDAEESYSSILKKNLESYSRALSMTDKSINMLVLPPSSLIAENHLPYDFSAPRYRSSTEMLPESFIFPLEELRLALEDRVYVTFRTDHHLTSEGAYLSYTLLFQKLGLIPYARDHFELVHLSDEFYGTYHSKNPIDISPDSFDLLYCDCFEDISVYAETENITLFDSEKLLKKDKYLFFQGGNHSLLNIRAEGDNKPKLLVIKDSYANAIVPFLSLHFDIDLVDPRYYKGDLSLLLDDDSYHSVLFIFGLSTLTSDATLSNKIK